MPKSNAKELAQWLESFGAERFFEAFLAVAQGAQSMCVYCGRHIYLDCAEGGGVPDWGTAIPGIDGLNYGCDSSPDTNEEGTGGHVPDKYRYDPA